MSTTEEQLTGALRRRDAELIVHDELDAIIDGDHIIRFAPKRHNRTRRSLLLTAAAAATLVVGAGGLIWAQRAEPIAPAEADSAQSAVPASFPRLQFPTTDSPAGPVLIGAQDYPIEGGWFSFANYEQNADLNYDGNLTRVQAFSIAIFTGTLADVGRVICGSPVDVVQGGRAIIVSERGPGQLRFVWNEGPDVLVVVDTYLSTDASMAAIDTLQPVDEDVWQRRLDALPAPEVIRDSTDRDAIWTLYVGATNTDDQLHPPLTTSAGQNSC
jgi:hypothetical protein